MPKLRPPGGRQAAAVIKETENEDHLQGAESLVTEQQDGGSVPDLEEHGSGVNADVSSSVLQAQIEALRKSNKEYEDRLNAERQQREAAQRSMQERDVELNRLQEQTANSNLEAINAALAAANAEAETAQRDIENAVSLGDHKGYAEASRKLARAEARLLNLENGKDALEREIKERPTKVEPKQSAQPDPLENFNIPDLAKQWLRDHPEYLKDPRKNSKLQALHWDVVDEGLAPYSKEYFEEMEQRLGLRQSRVIERQSQRQEDDMDDDVQPTRRAPVSAPPSREARSSDGTRSDSRITLNARQKEAAKIAGISEAEYAKQLLRLQKEKADGNYGGGQ